MRNHVYKVLEIVGSSETSIEDAIGTAVAQANKTVRNMDWFEVVETRGHIENGRIFDTERPKPSQSGLVEYRNRAARNPKKSGKAFRSATRGQPTCCE
jgi:dodecin